MRVPVIDVVYGKRLAYVVQFLLLVCLASCGGPAVNASQASTLLSPKATPSPEHYQVMTYSNLHYGPLPDEVLDLCLPANASTPRPGIIVIHGGGWTGGGKGTYEGNSDNVVPPSQSQELQNKLQQAQVPVQYISYHGGHGLSGLTQEQKDTIQTQVVAFLIAQEHP